MSRIKLFAILVLVAGVSAVFAQDTFVASDCDTAEITTALAEQIATVESAGEDEFLVALDELIVAANTHRLECAGLVLAGEPQEGKASYILGPFDIPAGLYKVIFTTAERALIQSEEISGDCSYIGFAVSAGEATNGTEEISEIGDSCRLVFTVEPNAAWELVLEPLS